jgi:transcription elongation factor Elf1
MKQTGLTNRPGQPLFRNLERPMMANETTQKTNPKAEPQSAAVETYFVSSCPVCGRVLRVLVQSLGQRAACPHCQASSVVDCRASFVVAGPERGAWQARHLPWARPRNDW